MVPWTHLREPPLWGKCLTDLTSEFTHFNLVIRLSKVQQFAFRLFTILRRPAVPAVPWETSELLPFSVKLCRTSETFLSYYCSSRFWSSTWHVWQQAIGMSFSCRCGLFGIWWGETYCASNSLELVQPFLPSWLTWLPSQQGNNARPLGFGTESCLVKFCFWELNSSLLLPSFRRNEPVDDSSYDILASSDTYDDIGNFLDSEPRDHARSC